jgi:nitroreductase
MTTLNLDAVGIKKAVIRSQHCQRNWDITKKIEAEDLEVLEHAVANCPSKQNVGFYNAYFIQDRAKIEQIHAQTKGFVINSSTGETVTNSQTLANLLIAFTRRDLKEWAKGHEHRNVQLDAFVADEETPAEYDQDLNNDAKIAVGIAAGYVNVLASMMGYATGCCSCFDMDGVKEILGTDDDVMLLMGVGVPNADRNRREHHLDSSVVFPTKEKVAIKVTHI